VRRGIDRHLRADALLRAAAAQDHDAGMAGGFQRVSEGAFLLPPLVVVSLVEEGELCLVILMSCGELGAKGGADYGFCITGLQGQGHDSEQVGRRVGVG
jgi:hypothetical protein